MLTRDLIARLPKAELHVHLDGSLRPETLIELSRDAGAPLPSSDPDAIRRFMLVDHAHNLEEFLRKFDTTIAVLQTPEAIERVAYEMCEDARRDNLRYLEVRYCPHLSTRQGLSLDEAIEAELRGLKRGEQDFGVVTRMINCSLRHYTPDVSFRIAEASVRYRDQGVVAFDLAGGEAGRPCGLHADAFDLAQEGRLGITVHAGEAAGAESIAEAIDLCHADRIGHGTRLYEDPRLRDYVRDRRIAIEVNITSNLQTRAVTAAAAHPVRDYFDRGLDVTLCTDSWLMCGVSLTDEYWLAHTALGFTRPEIDRMILNGFESAFLPWPEREKLVASVRDELAAIR
jgi:adenosine deaminase